MDDYAGTHVLSQRPDWGLEPLDRLDAVTCIHCGLDKAYWGDEPCPVTGGSHDDRPPTPCERTGECGEGACSYWAGSVHGCRYRG